METKAQNTTDIILPDQTLTRTEYASLLKKHYLRLLDSLDVNLKEALKGMDGFQLQDIPSDYKPSDKGSLHPKKLEDFAVRIGMLEDITSQILLSPKKIDTFFDTYVTDVMPDMEFWNDRDADNDFRNIALDILSLEWSPEQRTAFSLGFLAEFRHMLETGGFDFWKDRYCGSTHLYLREGNEYPDGDIFFIIPEPDGDLKRQIRIHCDFTPTKPERYKKVGYHGYDAQDDFYLIDKFTVTGPMDVCWNEHLKDVEGRLLRFLKDTVRHIGGIRI